MYDTRGKGETGRTRSRCVDGMHYRATRAVAEVRRWGTSTSGRIEGKGYGRFHGDGYGYNNGNHWPIMMLGRSMMSRLIEKQNVHGTGAPFGFSNTQWDTTD
jgi:hypothetical protein